MKDLFRRKIDLRNVFPGKNRKEILVLRKCAKIIHGGYREWSEDHGSVEPAVRNENIEQTQDLSYSVRGENIKTKFSKIVNSKGTIIA